CCRGGSSRSENRRLPGRTSHLEDRHLPHRRRPHLAARLVGPRCAGSFGAATIAKDRWDRMGNWDRTASRHRLVLEMKKGSRWGALVGAAVWLFGRFVGWVSAGEG